MLLCVREDPSSGASGNVVSVSVKLPRHVVACPELLSRRTLAVHGATMTWRIIWTTASIEEYDADGSAP